MLDLLKKLFNPAPEEKKIEIKDRIYIAACAMFIEVAKSDLSFDEVERTKIIDIMKKSFSLEEDYVKELMDLASQSVQKSISLYEFTPLINDRFSKEEKFALLKDLWRLVFADGRVDKYEEHLVKRIGNMIGTEHSDIIAAKLQVKEEMKI
jgi:uncharacterized tellurite resistance protein B-like protein